MIFARRERPGLWRRLRGLVSPAKGWRRGFSYIGKRVQRLPDTPHRVALGAACGVFASFTPFFTLHFVVALALAWALRANLLASAFGTAFGNPLTFPFIAGASLELGGWMLAVEKKVAGFNPGMVFTDLDRFLDRIFLPYLIGGILPGFACAVGAYLLLRPVVAAYQARRRAKLVAAARARVAAHLSRRRPKANPVAEAAEQR